MEVKHNPAKWSQRAAAASGDYEQGTARPRVSWSQAASGAESNYAAGVNAAIGEGAYGKGINKAGDGKWRKGIVEKGRARYSQGVAIAQSEYDAGYRPFADALRGVTLSPRGPKGTNYARVQEVGESLRNAKKSL